MCDSDDEKCRLADSRTPPSRVAAGAFRGVLCGADQAVGSSTSRLRVRFGSIWMPGLVVVETVIFLM